MIRAHTGGTRQWDDSLVVRRISNQYMIELSEWCKTDGVVRATRKRQNDETFHYDFKFLWRRQKQPLQHMGALNSHAVKTAMRAFFEEAHERLRLFSFVGLYFVRDVEGWIARILDDIERQVAEESERDALNGQLALTLDGEPITTAALHESEARTTMTRFYDTIAHNLPFGVIPLGYSERDCYGQYAQVENRVAMTRTLCFLPVETGYAQLYDFHVIDAGAEFVPPALADQEQYMRITRHNGVAAGELLPVSDFAALYVEASKLNEAETHLMDWTAMHVYQDEYAIALPQPDTPLEELVEPNLTTVESMLGVRQSDAKARESASLQNARAQIERLAMRHSMYKTPQQQSAPPIGAQRVQQFGRPSRIDFLQYIPKSVQMAPSNSPPPNYDLAAMRLAYEQNVCATRRLPYEFYKTASQQGGGGALIQRDALASMEQARKPLNVEIAAQHALYDRLFKEVHARTLRQMEKGVLDTLEFYDELESAVEFEPVVTKSDAPLSDLFEAYKLGLVDPVIVRRQMYQAYDIEEDPARAPPPLPDFLIPNSNKPEAGGGADKKRKRGD